MNKLITITLRLEDGTKVSHYSHTLDWSYIVNDIHGNGYSIVRVLVDDDDNLTVIIKEN